MDRVLNPYFMKGKIKAAIRDLKFKKYPKIGNGDKKRRNRFKIYRNKYIGPFSPIFHGYNNLTESARRYDAIMVGSDQLWTPAGIKSRFYNLLFVPEEMKKISFATSFGVSSIPESQKKMTADYLRRIDAISVREIKGKEIVYELTGRKAFLALDPTLLYSGKEWIDMFPNIKKYKEPYILAYFLGNNPNHRIVVNRISKKTGLRILTIPFMDLFADCDLSFGDEQLYDVDPIDFLNLIRNADYICTDSFHGTVFSILNHKKFLTFERTNSDDKLSRNSRIDSLFSLLDLEERRYKSGIIPEERIDMFIDYTKVDQRLSSLRKETFKFLNDALNS